MLTVRAWNDGTGDSATDNYRVWVYVNRRVIWWGFVSGHDRTKGWTQLLRDIADRAEKIETFSLDEPDVHQKEGING